MNNCYYSIIELNNVTRSKGKEKYNRNMRNKGNTKNLARIKLLLVLFVEHEI